MILPLWPSRPDRSRATDARPRRAGRGLATAAAALLILAAPAMAQGPGWGPQPGWGPGGGQWGAGPWGNGPWGGYPWGWGPGQAGPGQAGPGQGGPEDRQPAAIEVTGSGEASVAPDLAVITLGVTVQAPTAGEAMRQNATRQRAVIVTLNRNGVAARDIQTSNLSLNPVQNYPEGQPPVITGYNAGNMVTVRIRDLPQLGPILDALVGAGANEIQGVTFSREDADEVEAEARRNAVANARDRAEVIAEAAGQRLGRLISLSDLAQPSPPRPMMMRAMAADSGAPPVETGELNISAQVTATWEMLPARDEGRGGWGRAPDGDDHGPMGRGGHGMGHRKHGGGDMDRGDDRPDEETPPPIDSPIGTAGEAPSSAPDAAAPVGTPSPGPATPGASPQPPAPSAPAAAAPLGGSSDTAAPPAVSAPTLGTPPVSN